MLLWKLAKKSSPASHMETRSSDAHSVKPNIMKTSDILSADLLDLLFDGRNKNYGAYDLRKTYNRRINLALAGTAFVCLLFVAGSILAGGKKTKAVDLVNDVVLQDYKEPAKPEPVQPPLPKPEPPKIEMARFTPPLIVKDDQVKQDDEIKDVAILDDIKIGTVNQEGIKDDIVTPPVEKAVSNAEPPKVDDDIDKIFPTVQIEAQFEGGLEGWRKYLTRNLNSDLPSQNGAPAAAYTVVVSFIVDRSGLISDVKAENDPGYGTKAEAIRVIQKGPKWKPAQQNGRSVIYRQRQVITFQVREE